VIEQGVDCPVQVVVGKKSPLLALTPEIIKPAVAGILIVIGALVVPNVCDGNLIGLMTGNLDALAAFPSTDSTSVGHTTVGVGFGVGVIVGVAGAVAVAVGVAVGVGVRKTVGVAVGVIVAIAVAVAVGVAVAVAVKVAVAVAVNVAVGVGVGAAVAVEVAVAVAVDVAVGVGVDWLGVGVDVGQPPSKGETSRL
jgi:hypothetical protein